MRVAVIMLIGVTLDSTRGHRSNLALTKHHVVVMSVVGDPLEL
jgi:hypothetical protein